MKRTSDSFLSTNNNLYPYQSSDNISHFVVLPEDVIIRIFSLLSQPTLRQICTVSKTFAAQASDDILWQPIAETILLPQELKSKNESYKDFCRDLLSPFKFIYTPSKGTAALTHYIPPRNPDIIHRIKRLKLPKYKILQHSELPAFFQLNGVKKIINSLYDRILPCLDELAKYEQRSTLRSSNKSLNTLTRVISEGSNYEINHIGQQEVGRTKFHMMNASDYVISFDENFHMLIDNKRTEIIIPHTSQLHISTTPTHLRIFISIQGNDIVKGIKCAKTALETKNVTKIDWGQF